MKNLVFILFFVVLTNSLLCKKSLDFHIEDEVVVVTVNFSSEGTIRFSSITVNQKLNMFLFKVESDDQSNSSIILQKSEFEIGENNITYYCQDSYVANIWKFTCVVE